jgi:hypothetical protein
LTLTPRQALNALIATRHNAVNLAEPQIAINEAQEAFEKSMVDALEGKPVLAAVVHEEIPPHVAEPQETDNSPSSTEPPTIAPQTPA